MSTQLFPDWWAAIITCLKLLLESLTLYYCLHKCNKSAHYQGCYQGGQYIIHVIYYVLRLIWGCISPILDQLMAKEFLLSPDNKNLRIGLPGCTEVSGSAVTLTTRFESWMKTFLVDFVFYPVSAWAFSLSPKVQKPAWVNLSVSVHGWVYMFASVQKM